MSFYKRYRLLSLCYDGAGEDLVALNLLRKLLSSREDPNCVPALLLVPKICGDQNLSIEGVSYARRAIGSLDNNNGCNHLESTANWLLGVPLSSRSKSAVTNSERIGFQSESLRVLESTGKTARMNDPGILYHLSLVNAEQRKMETALYYVKLLLKLEGGSNIERWLLLARIFSALKRYVDSETIIDAALNQTGKWDQGVLLRTKAKLQIVQGQLKRAIETYTQLLDVVQVQSKSFGSGKKLCNKHEFRQGVSSPAGILEFEVWNDLANVYIRQKQWHDAEICLSKIKAIGPNSPARLHTKDRTLRADLVSTMESRLDTQLQPCTLPPDAQFYQSPSGSAEASLQIRTGDKNSSTVDFILGSWIHSQLPTGGELNITILSAFLNSSTDAPNFLIEMIQMGPTSMVLILDLPPRKEPMLYHEYLQTFYEDTKLESCREMIEKLPEVQPYFSSSPYIRRLTSPTAVMIRINTKSGGAERLQEIVKDHLYPVAKQVLGIWLDHCACGSRNVTEVDKDYLKKRDMLIKDKTIEIVWSRGCRPSNAAIPEVFSA